MTNDMLIAYYSQSGQTRRIAKLLAEKTGADLYEIEPARKYNDDMWKAWDEAQAERRENHYPELKGSLPDINGYSTILVGGAVWGFTLANPVTTFMREMDFTGKKVSAFWTFYDHDEKYDNDMRAETKNGKYIKGLPLPRALVASKEKTNEAIDQWLSTLQSKINKEDFSMEKIRLNDGVEIPVFGFGTFQIPADGSTYKAVRNALDLGIYHIDTAAAYFNEQEVGQAIKDSGIPREEIFLTSKLWLQDYGYEAAKKGIDTSLRKLGLDYMDLYLIHQPYGDVPGAWKAMEEAKAERKIRSIGVSNMTPKIWNSFVPQFNTMPSVNQIEFNPYQQQKAIREIMSKNNVVLEGWGPLGQGNKEMLADPVIARIAETHGKDVGQIILRFEHQEGAIIFPKSTKPERIRSNMEIFDFSLTDAEMDEIRALDKGHGVHDPDAPGVAEFLASAFDVHADD